MSTRTLADESGDLLVSRALVRQQVCPLVLVRRVVDDAGVTQVLSRYFAVGRAIFSGSRRPRESPQRILGSGPHGLQGVEAWKDAELRHLRRYCPSSEICPEIWVQSKPLVDA